MLKKMAVFLMFVFFGAIAVALIVFFTGCISAPDKDDFPLPYTYEKAYCDYANQKNPDKSNCNGYLSIIENREKEKRFYDRNKFCLDPTNRPKHYDWEKCVLFLNQK